MGVVAPSIGLEPEASGDITRKIPLFSAEDSLSAYSHAQIGKRF